MPSTPFTELISFPSSTIFGPAKVQFQYNAATTCKFEPSILTKTIISRQLLYGINHITGMELQNVLTIAALALAFATLYSKLIGETSLVENILHNLFQTRTSAGSLAILETADLHLFFAPEYAALQCSVGHMHMMLHDDEGACLFVQQKR